jgi:DNA-binding NarL/FixJ family response regulator
MVKVVLIDDSAAIRTSLGRLLGSIPGVEIAGSADDVVGALSLIASTRPDVVVLDANLLQGDRGIDVLRYVRRQRPEIRVIVLSNDGSSRLRDTFLEAGARAYFDKASEFMQARDWVADEVRSLHV